MSTFLPISTHNAIRDRVHESSKKQGSGGESFFLEGEAEQPDVHKNASAKAKNTKEDSNPFSKIGKESKSSSSNTPNSPQKTNPKEEQEEAYILAFEDVPAGSTYDDDASLNTPKTQVDRSNFHKQI